MPDSSEVIAFLDALPSEHRATWTPDAITALIEQARDDAQRQWPELVTDATAVGAWLGGRVDAAAGPATAETLELASLVLTYACAHALPGALKAFRACHGADVDSALRRLGLDDSAAQDVRQVVWGKLFVAGSEKIRAYNGRGPLGGWVRAVAVRQAISMGRRRAPLDLAGQDLPAQLPALSDPEREYLQGRYGDAVRAALHHAVSQLAAEDRNLLRFRFADGLTLDELARVFDVHRATVARRLAKARSEVRRAALQNLRAELNADPSEIASVVRLVRSQLDLSISGLLGK